MSDMDNMLSGHSSMFSKKRKLALMDTISQPKRRKVVRSVKKHKLLVRDHDGRLREILPTDTLWYQLYVSQPPSSSRHAKLFRQRFRLPYQSFLELSSQLFNHDMFIQWRSTDAVGNPPSNFKLLLLGALRYIGRAWTLDDVSEANGISIHTNSAFLKVFINYGSSVLYQKHVIQPLIDNGVKDQEKVFASAGFDGCIGSTDATHVPMLKYPHWAHNNHKGFKLSAPARTYNVTVDHSRRILGTTSGHPGTWNDKSLILYDELICQVKKGVIPDNFSFKLYEYDHNNNIVEATYKGVWFMVDN